MATFKYETRQRRMISNAPSNTNIRVNQTVMMFDEEIEEHSGQSHSSSQHADYCSSNTSWSDLIERYESLNHGEYQKLLADIATLRHERDRLEASVRRQTGEDLPSGATAAGLGHLEQKLECALGKVREMKDKLLEEQLGESHHRVSCCSRKLGNRNDLRCRQALVNDRAYASVHV
ncbi:MADS-box transcription factor 30-like [Triticum aestivum]|uniref:MADS-box transcription factor 30-like n=1 Tax=Triticum aestivum TaxID=4565 RepID=UPI001D011427|nr:MADS-box transcription factor 30-like [Triticum aestivum]